jgi:sugar lactone lactonase YvrE
MALFKSSDANPQILEVSPVAAIPGGEFRIRGKGLSGPERPQVRFGRADAPIVISSESYVIVRVPEGASGGELSLGQDAADGEVTHYATWSCQIGVQIADGLHPVSNPVVDPAGNIFTTFSGPAGQKTAVSVYKIEPGQPPKPLVTDMMNATGLALDREDALYVSSRHDGVVYQVSAEGKAAPYVEGMGVATGMVFDLEGNLFVGDRSGTIFKINPERQIFVHATLEPSVAAYHLAVDASGTLFVTGPTLSSNEAIWAISPNGDTRAWYRGLGRPQGLALSREGDIYVVACLHGLRGLVRITAGGKASLALAGPNLVGVAFSPLGSTILTTSDAVYEVDLGVEGLELF